MNIHQARAKADILKALANPVRLVVVDALRRGDLCVGDLNKLVRIRQPTLSRHLHLLKKAGIVTERKEGPRVIHHLETPCILQAFDCASRVLANHLSRQKSVM